MALATIMVSAFWLILFVALGVFEITLTPEAAGRIAFALLATVVLALIHDGLDRLEQRDRS